jgi:hypothetical protein
VVRSEKMMGTLLPNRSGEPDPWRNNKHQHRNQSNQGKQGNEEQLEIYLKFYEQSQNAQIPK